MLDLRAAVFVDEQGVPAELEQDGRDAGADHAVLFDVAGRALATGRLLDPGPRSPGAQPVGVIGRVAVDAGWRGRGLGLTITEALTERARERGLPAVELHAQLQVADFYVRQGYRVIAEPDVEAGIEHVWMRRDLAPGLREARATDVAALRALIGTDLPSTMGTAHAVAPGGLPRTDPVGLPRVATPGGAPHVMWVVPGEADDPDPARRLLACVAVRLCPGGERSDADWPGAGVEADGPDGGEYGRGAGRKATSPAGPQPTLVAEVTSLWVARPARRSGLGTTLVRRCERAVRHWRSVQIAESAPAVSQVPQGEPTQATLPTQPAPTAQVVLWCDLRFADAHRLWRRLGYVPTGRSRPRPAAATAAEHASTSAGTDSTATEIEFRRSLPHRIPGR